MTTTHRLALALAAATLLAAAAILLATARHDTATAAPAAAAGDERSAAAGDFAILRRAIGPRDRPTPAMERFAGSYAGGARRAALPMGAPPVHVVARERDLCIEVDVDGPAFGCAPYAHARTGRLHLTLSGGPGMEPGTAIAVGLVPDTVRDVALVGAGGERTVLPTYEGVYATGPTKAAAISVGGERIELSTLPGRDE
jgi:hypothetical protein